MSRQQMTALTSDGVSERRHLTLDRTSGGLIVVQEAHTAVHMGTAFHVASYVDLALSAVYDIQITTPDQDAWVHLAWEIDCEAETLWHLYENVSIVTPGTARTPINQNRNSSNTSNVIIKTIENSSVANANADTAVAGATVLMEGISGGRNLPGSIAFTEELILKPNEDYCIRLIANVAGYIDYHIDFHEWEDRI